MLQSVLFTVQCHIEEVVQTHQEEGFPQDRANRIHGGLR